MSKAISLFCIIFLLSVCTLQAQHLEFDDLVAFIGSPSSSVKAKLSFKEFTLTHHDGTPMYTYKGNAQETLNFLDFDSKTYNVSYWLLNKPHFLKIRSDVRLMIDRRSLKEDNKTIEELYVTPKYKITLSAMKGSGIFIVEIESNKLY